MGIINFFYILDLIFEPKTLASHPKYQKTSILAEFPIKTWAKYYHLVVWTQGQMKWAKKA